MPTAILVDGDFFLRRYRYLRGNAAPERVAKDLHWMARQHLIQDRGRDNKKHLEQDRRRDNRTLYRIFFYDCPPLQHKVHNPITGNAIDYSKTEVAHWRLAFHEELRKLRKVALRLGYLNERSGQWVLGGKKLKQLLSGKITLQDLTDRDVRYDVAQKGVDMRIGLDIASMAYKRQVDQIVLVAGDSDFVPAAKLARREGIDFILDPMWAPIRQDLYEHIDGLQSVFNRKNKASIDADATSEAARPQED